MDVFTGQMTTAVLGSYKENNVLFVNVPANMTNYYQPLNLTVNSYAKWYMKNKFNSWYSKRVKQQLDNAVNLKDVNFKLQLTTIKPIHASWLIEFHNHMSTNFGKEKIEGGRKTFGIIDVLKLGTKQLYSINDLDPMVTAVEITQKEQLLAICKLRLF